MKKPVVAGLIGGLIMLAAGMLVSNVFQMLIPSLKAEFENTNLFRSWTDPLMLLYFVHPFFMGLILAWIWSKTKILFPAAGSAVSNGLRFGMLYWITNLPGMVISYSSFPLSFAMISEWTISNLVEGLCVGIFLAKVMK